MFGNYPLIVVATIFYLTGVNYAQPFYEFTNPVRNTHYGYAKAVWVSENGTVFLANDWGGLRAYTYDGHSFKRAGAIDDDYSVADVVTTSDGTVLIAAAHGLRAYTYDGSSFVYRTHTDDGYALGIALAEDGNIFVGKGSQGLGAYTYDGSSFTNSAHIDDIETGAAETVAVGPEGRIYLANGYGGNLRVYRYNDSSLSNISLNQTEETQET